MRFFENGPPIPDELLEARDQGQVLLFCGAGVSRAKALLPGFLELAQRVLKELRTLSDSPARRLTEFAATLEREPIQGVGGILAADRIFGLLERDFDLADIERAVGGALKPDVGASLEAHRVLLTLSRGPGGKAQLVTTNFDLLFEAADPSLPVWTPSRLPDLRRPGNLTGIIHLHGMLDSDYRRAVDGRLVLSSAEFGRAYLAEGWATDFIRAAIARYRIVFVGYTAEDPPVQYLLEALNRSAVAGRQGLYAFQNGRASEVAALWKQKGVHAIAYSGDNGHAELWKTLSAWAERARDPHRWRSRLLNRARRGPAEMNPHERGQIVHLAATEEGARTLAEAKRPLPAQWLCVFDPTIRYGTPKIANFSSLAAPEVDPFVRYAIDSDPMPPREWQGNFNRRETPRDVVDVLAPLALDGDRGYTAGLSASHGNAVAQIPPRLVSLSVWFGRVCGEPSAMWWAAGQRGLHPMMQRNVHFALDGRAGNLTPHARMIWRYLFDVWRQTEHNSVHEVYALNHRLLKEGWTPASRRAFASHFQPLLKVERAPGALPPTEKQRLRPADVFWLSVRYPEEHFAIEIPDRELEAILPLLRRNLERAGALENELRPFDLNIPPIEPDPNLPGESSDRSWGPNPQILRFTHLFRRLAAQDGAAAAREFASWPWNDDPIFARLRIWAAGLSGLLDSDLVGRTLIEASDRVFWGMRDQRDLLLALASRWNELSAPHRKQLETRLRKGPPKKRNLDRAYFPKFRAYSIVNRLSWMGERGCQFNFDVAALVAKMRRHIPDWTEANGLQAADSMEGRVGSVHADTSFAGFNDTPIGTLVERALGTNGHGQRLFLERDPYGGLAESRPLRVLAALRQLHEASKTAQIGWTRFLQSGARLKDKPRLAALLARRLATVEPVVLATVVRAAAIWLEQNGKRIFAADGDAVWALFDRLAGTIAADPERSLPKTASAGTERDWFQAAWSSAAGCLAAALLADPQLSAVAVQAGLPVMWTDRAAVLLDLPGDHGRFVVAQFARNLSWLYALDPRWAARAIIKAIDQEGDNRDAILAGFFSNPKIRGEELFGRLKPALLAMVKFEAPPRKQRENVLAGLFISAWRTTTDVGTRYCSDDELRTVIIHGSDAMRTHMLWTVGHWEYSDKLALLRDIWPLQLAVRSAAVSGRLCDLAFGDEDNFVALSDAILPVLSPIDGGDPLLSIPPEKQTKIFARYPRKVVEILLRILPEQSQSWPYNMADVLAKLLRAEPSLAKDSTFAELRRRHSRAR